MVLSSNRGRRRRRLGRITDGAMEEEMEVEGTAEGDGGTEVDWVF